VIFLDINTFYGPSAGGIRTYHQAKLEWFSRQDEHAYFLIHPGPVARVERVTPRVTVIQVPGIRLTQDPAGYRLILNYLPVARWIRRIRPDVIEAGDAWLTSWFCLAFKALGAWNGTLVSFYHSDPVPTYFEPWAARGGRLRRGVVTILAPVFYAVQRRFDGTGVSSRFVRDALLRQGVANTRHLPFGTDPVYFTRSSPTIPLRRAGATPESAPVRFLYAGRLDADKGIDLLLEVWESLLENPDATITVAGRGAYAARFQAIQHPRFHFLGFVGDRRAMAGLYAAQDILLAPGPHETFGMSVLEGMASGLTVIGPTAGGTGELLDEVGSPFRFTPGDAPDFLDKARAAAASDLSAWSQRHYEIAQRYGTWEDSVRNMIEAWTETAGEKA